MAYQAFRIHQVENVEVGRTLGEAEGVPGLVALVALIVASLHTAAVQDASPSFEEVVGEVSPSLEL